MKQMIGFVILLLWLGPFLVLFANSGDWRVPPFDEFSSVLWFTLGQAFLSSVVSLIFGFVGALGLVSLPQNRTLTSAKFFTLIPNVVPTLMVILGAMNVWPGGRGLAGIIWVHTLLNAGLVATVFAGLISSRIGKMAELAWVEGVSRQKFLVRVAMPLLKMDFLRVGLFVFAICVASFAVPLILGGSRATTMEVLIYEKIRMTLDWSTALGLAGLQTAIVLLLSWVLKQSNEEQLRETVNVPLLSWPPGLIIAFLPTAVVVTGLLLRLPKAFTEIQALSGFASEWPQLALGSFIVAILTGLFTTLLLLLLLVAQPSGWLRKSLLGYAAPSSVLVGFSILILWRAGGLASLVKIAIGLTLISVPAFYRLYWDSLISSLRNQVTTARTLGASHLQIALSVLIPQAWETCMFLAGLAAFWAWGDFALSAVIGENTLTLGMLTHSLANTYRLASATILAWVLILGGALTFALFWGAGRVFSSRSQS